MNAGWIFLTVILAGGLAWAVVRGSLEWPSYMQRRRQRKSEQAKAGVRPNSRRG